MYQAIYKCRLCGEKFQIGKLYTENGVIRKSTKLSMILPLIPSDRGYTCHYCQENCIGIADFIGFGKVEE